MPERGTSGNVSDLRPPWGDSAAKAADESASAEAAHGCLHTATGSGHQTRNRDALPRLCTA